MNHFALLLTAVLAVGASVPQPSREIKVFLGEKGASILRSPTKVEIFRIKPRRQKDAKNQIGGYPITATANEPGKEVVSKWSALLLDKSSYVNASRQDGEMGKLCGFSPGVALRFWKDKEVVEVLLCYGCDEIRFLTRDAEGKPVDPGRKPGRVPVKGEGKGDVPREQRNDYFDPARSAFVKLAKAAFPKDKDIQDLPEKNER